LHVLWEGYANSILQVTCMTESHAVSVMFSNDALVYVDQL
jgi:hypothetical protein